jgi:hypothetical protein
MAPRGSLTHGCRSCRRRYRQRSFFVNDNHGDALTDICRECRQEPTKSQGLTARGYAVEDDDSADSGHRNSYSCSSSTRCVFLLLTAFCSPRELTGFVIVAAPSRKSFPYSSTSCLHSTEAAAAYRTAGSTGTIGNGPLPYHESTNTTYASTTREYDDDDDFISLSDDKYWDEALSLRAFNMDLQNLAMEDPHKAQDALEIMIDLHNNNNNHSNRMASMSSNENVPKKIRIPFSRMRLAIRP